MDIKKYFANLDSNEITAELYKKVENYQKYLVTSGRLGLMRKSYNFYYSPALKGSKLNRVGENGELVKVDVNHYRNLLLHQKTLVTQQRPAFEPRATNSDMKSQAQCVLASGLLDYYLREKKIERNINSALEYCLVLAEGFIETVWDTEQGEKFADTEIVDPKTGEVTLKEIRDGDIRVINHLGVNVIRDFNKGDAESHDWLIVRSYKNRYDLMAQFPDLASQIAELPNRNDQSFKDTILITNYAQGEDSDDIPIYTFYHKKTSAVPDGRMVQFLNPEIYTIDSPLPYRGIPVYRIAPEEQIGSSFGYTVGYDLIPVLEAVNVLYSTIITNQSTFGVQNILMPKGSDISVTSIAGGLNLMEYDPKVGEPKALNLTQTPPEIFNMISILEKTGETLSGSNSLIRGNPEASLKSGSALALVQATAITFSMSLQQSYTQLLEDVGTSIINLLRDYASTPRVAMIAGKSQKPYMKEFKGDDLQYINRVVVDMGNPLSRTTAGKVNLAESLMKNNLIKNADQYIQVITTGRLEPVIEPTQMELLNIKAENEEMTEGRDVVVVITDSHAQHIQEHKAVLASPEARRDPDLVARVTAHIQEHIDELMTLSQSNPLLLQILGQPIQAMPQMPLANGAPMTPQSPVQASAEQVNMPNMPIAPQDDPEGGGM